MKHFLSFFLTVRFKDSMQSFDKGMEAYEKGNYSTALNIWAPLAQQGDSSAQTGLGLISLNGKGLPQNDEIALQWFRLAVEQGHPNAQVGLGLIYNYGQGVPRNDETAVKWYALSAEQGNALAQVALSGG